jgi:hypothetical protein
MGKSKLTKTEKGKAGEEQSQKLVHIFFDFKEIFIQNSSW